MLVSAALYSLARYKQSTLENCSCKFTSSFGVLNFNKFEYASDSIFAYDTELNNFIGNKLYLLKTYFKGRTKQNIKYFKPKKIWI